MSVVLDIEPTTAHRFARPDADPRLGWTRCGIRFAWAEARNRWARLARCRACWS
jgi:hypothetical protein